MDVILIAYIAAFSFGFVYRYVIKAFAPKKFKKNAQPNIGKPDKVFRFLIAVALLVSGMYFNSFIMLFFSGFTVFEVLFSWCGFYALLGRNTCPIN